MPLAPFSAGCQSLPLQPTIKLDPSGADSWLVGLCTFWDPVDLPNELSCEAGCFSRHLKPHRCFQSGVLKLYFPVLDPWVARSVSLPSCSGLSAQRCGSTCSTSRCLSHPGLLATALLQVLSSRLPVSTPRTGLDEYFFFNSLFVGLQYSSIFWHFWLFFYF